jgi:hypothetical protein
MLDPLNHIVDSLADHVEPRDNFVSQGMVVPAFRLFMIERRLQRPHFAFKLELIILK